MATFSLKYPENTDGTFYVDQECIACDTCAGIAPKNFMLTDTYTHAFVFRQPENEMQKQACDMALASCPVDAIGKSMDAHS